jgi:simple sugar transport system permease protein
MDVFASVVVNWLASTPSFAVPFALAALGLIVSERAGVLSLGAEGFLLVGALAGIGARLALGDGAAAGALSLAASMAAAAVVALLFATLVVLLRVNQVIAGLALVFFCQGLTSLLGALFGWTNRTVPGIGELALWPLSELPVLGRVLFTQDAVVYLTPLVFLGATWVLTRTTLGLRLRAVGENPEAADAAGISVVGYRFAAILAGAALIGLAGGYISVVSTKLWVDGMSGGRGWIAIGLVIFARWAPWRALGGAVLFGCIEALIPQLAAAGVRLPQYFVMMTPYVVTLAVMIWVATRTLGRHDGEPGALGEPYVREERR